MSEREKELTERLAELEYLLAVANENLNSISHQCAETCETMDQLVKIIIAILLQEKGVYRIRSEYMETAASSQAFSCFPTKDSYVVMLSSDSEIPIG